MPVRIYEIAKKLGVDNKAVLSKAKELGITQAKVPSSSLDKITAEYLEIQLGGEPSIPVPEPEAAPASEPVLITAPAEEEKADEEKPAGDSSESAEEMSSESAEADVEGDSTEPEGADDSQPEESVESVDTADDDQAAEDTGGDSDSETAEEAEDEGPEVPKLGEKVGFIQLPTRPAARGRGAKPERPPKKEAPAARGPQDGFRDRGGDRGRRQDGRRGPGGPQRSEPPRQQKQARKPKFAVASDADAVILKQPIIVRDLAEKLGRKPFQVIADLMDMGVFASVNQTITEDSARDVCGKYGLRFELEKRERGAGVVKAEPKKVVLDSDDKEEDLLPRAPVVTIMGHVDHGKTTLLDYIRKATVASGEAGGITQHIGAYTIALPHPERKEEMQQITFLDTPGHAAFSAMRARGANVTDIVILVVAANDGVMPQTMEALNHAKAAEVPIIVAVNKCDHPAANPMQPRQQLQEKGLQPEEWGGETIFVDVSALAGTGVEQLLEMVLLQAEVMELKANLNRKAVGNVIESGMEPGGPVATVLVRKGTLKLGDTLICGQYYGRARALIDEEGTRQKEAGPSTAVRVLGLNGVPEAGLEFNVVKNEKEARGLAEERETEARAESHEKRGSKVSLENLFRTLEADAGKTLKVVVKADTQGSVEAIVDALNKIDSDKVELDVIHSAVGAVTESDVLLASASAAIVIGFHTRVDGSAKTAAKRETVQIKQYTVIYELIDQIKEAMAGLLDPELRSVTTGKAEIRQVFDLSKAGKIAGCIVQDGKMTKGKVRVLRGDDVLHEGLLVTLRRFQEDVAEVGSGLECGIRIGAFNDFQEGDTLECYEVEKIAQKL